MAEYGDRAVLWGAKAAVDLSGPTYRIGLLDSNGEADLTTAAADKVFGIIQNVPESGEEAALLASGISKVRAGNTIARNDYFMSDASGTAVVANSTATTKVIGQAITASASGGLFTGYINIREII
jgi:hypothetical protein